MILSSKENQCKGCTQQMRLEVAVFETADCHGRQAMNRERWGLIDDSQSGSVVANSV